MNRASAPVRAGDVRGAGAGAAPPAGAAAPAAAFAAADILPRAPAAVRRARARADAASARADPAAPPALRFLEHRTRRRVCGGDVRLQPPARRDCCGSPAGQAPLPGGLRTVPAELGAATRRVSSAGEPAAKRLSLRARRARRPSAPNRSADALQRSRKRASRRRSR